MTRILFVCTGNVHRSVLAERLLATKLPPGSALRPESAGTDAWHRFPMEDTTRAVLEELGGDGSGFASRPLTAQLMAGAPLVLGLAREHREAAVRLAPVAMRRCFTLKEFVRLAEGAAEGGGGFEAVVAAAATRRGAAAPVPPAEDDIPDPWRRPREELYECALEIDRAVSGLVRLWTMRHQGPPSDMRHHSPAPHGEAPLGRASAE
ncbi:low molecular weight phosphatase family protein [Streptomyces sp. ID05-04B]|uniref:arsenate reductase/protein-tyrosine-phosphatase family protein n=1 Tax=unclassified Streptomyces TaxID=2593676 RepID=UPI000D19DFC1|nr:MULTISPECIES: low molecular weight phosphatase family protein [unclassified Streptomyces]AVV40706.1 low molecular weight phosphatase family protein [Streptomyces sp. P3]MDX5565733.1 low molecular weight phosphatase family protein [Streptomyces sp. ID05-04B]